MAALTSKTVRTCPALLLDAFLACRAVLEELLHEQERTGPDLPVERLQGQAGTSDHQFDSAASQTPTDTTGGRGVVLDLRAQGRRHELIPASGQSHGR